jgi:hypothetical protein
MASARSGRGPGSDGRACSASTNATGWR